MLVCEKIKPPVSGAGAHPEPDEEADDDGCGDIEQAGLGAEDTAGKEGRSALLYRKERRAQGFDTAHREAENVALKEIPAYVQPDRDGEAPREDVADPQEESGEGYVDRADGRGIRVLQVQQTKEELGEHQRQKDRAFGTYLRKVQPLGHVL